MQLTGSYKVRGAYYKISTLTQEQKDYETAFKYFLLSANEEESWACNKVAEYYRQGIYVKKDRYNYSGW